MMLQTATCFELQPSCPNLSTTILNPRISRDSGLKGLN